MIRAYETLLFYTFLIFKNGAGKKVFLWLVVLKSVKLGLIIKIFPNSMKFGYDMLNLDSSHPLEDETQIPKDKDFL